MVWLIMCIKPGSYTVTMKNRCKMTINIDIWIWVGQVSILEKFKWSRNFCNYSLNWPVHVKKNHCLMAILHVFSIQTAYEPCLALVIFIGWSAHRFPVLTFTPIPDKTNGQSLENLVINQILYREYTHCTADKTMSIALSLALKRQRRSFCWNV
jgi:hypothetical protein